MSDHSFRISCCMCPESWKTTITLPDGWATRYDGTDQEHGFCPEHALISGFCNSQCPGCVGGWGDYPLFDAFAYTSKKMSLTEADFDAIESGVCPKRVNGTMSFDTRTGVMETLDLRDDLCVAGGKTLSQAIKDYVKRYTKDGEE